MRHKGFISEKERRARSEITKILGWLPYIEGGLVKMERKCGKANCHCVEGKKHESMYLSCRYKGKRKMIYIPSEIEKQIEEGIKNYQRGSKLLGEISTRNLNRIIKGVEKEDE